MPILKKTYGFLLLPFIFFLTLFSTYLLEFPAFLGFIILILSSTVILLSYSEYIYGKFALYVGFLTLFYFLQIIYPIDFIYNLFFIVIPGFIICLYSYKYKKQVENRTFIFFIQIYFTIIFIILSVYFTYIKNINIYNTLYDYIKFIFITLNTADAPIVPEEVFQLAPFLVVILILIAWIIFLKISYYIYGCYNTPIIVSNNWYLNKYHDITTILCIVIAFVSNKIFDYYSNFVYTTYVLSMVFLGSYLLLVFRYCMAKGFAYLCALFLGIVVLDILALNVLISFGILSALGVLINLRVIK